jgi:hypothetical protein
MDGINKENIRNISINNNSINNSKNNNKNIDNFISNNYINNNTITNYINNINYYIPTNNCKTLKNFLFKIIDINKILFLLSNYKGSIFLQKCLIESNNYEISLLFGIIYPQISKIMCLEYGNYFIQKLIKRLNVIQRLNIFKAIEKDFLNIAINKRGTHSIQALIQRIESPIELILFEQLLNQNLLLLFNNENAYHIIMKIIMEKPENQRNNINYFFINNLEKIIINPYGAYCGNKFVLYNTDLYLRLVLIKSIQKNIKSLMFTKASCSFLLLSINRFNINNFEFIIEEIQNNLSLLSLNSVSNSFIMKLLTHLKNNDNNRISSIIWNIYKNDNLINQLCSHKNGIKLVKTLMEYNNDIQKKYIKKK